MEVQREDGVYPTWVLCSNSVSPAINPFGRSPIRPSGWCRTRRSQRIVVQVACATSCTEAKAGRAARRRAKRRGSNACCSLGVVIINRAFYAAGVVDELILTVCPVVVGRRSGVPVVAPSGGSGPFGIDQTETEGDLLPSITL